MQSQRQSQPGDANPLAGGSRGGLLEASPLSGYTGAAGAYDELLTPQGGVRPQWQGLAGRLRDIGDAALRRRWSHSQRLIKANGVAYSPHAGHDAARPWTLDPLPMVISRQQWQSVAAGLAQRAQVLDLTLRDLFGPQELIRTGVLPADVLYAHPGYLLPLRRLPPADAAEASQRMLRLYAADLGRAPNGAWWVLNDRTESPSGIGFALENRIVISRMLPDAFRDCRVLRLAGYLGQLRESLEGPAGQTHARSQIAILTQGAGRPNYFEDAYLARYLGFTLVEGEDLTVRGRRLWLKTLQGLVPVDVLVRRPNTEQCDPLEMGGASPAGVAGLIQAAREGNLVVANALGSGLVESQVFMAYLPRLSRALLGEDLKLPGVATWWCGERSSLDYVLQNLDHLLLKHAYRQRGRESLVSDHLRDATPDDLAKLIKKDPRAYVAQERVERSSAPVWQDGRVQAGRVALRAFATARDDRYEVMEGALARITYTAEPLEVSSLTGEGSKDVWIVSDQPVEPTTLLSTDDEPVALVRRGAELPSRVADNSYWLGRQLERADAQAKLIRTIAIRITGEADPSDLPELTLLLRALAEHGLIEPGYAVEELRELLPHVDRSLPSQVLGAHSGDSLSETVERVFVAAAKVRDRLSRDTWGALLQMRELMAGPDATASDLTDLINTADELIVNLAAIGGMVVESMTRTQFYRFLDIGRRLERAVQLTDLLNVCLVERHSTVDPLLEALLETSDSLMTYRSRYRSSIRFAAVLDLLITDQSNPRSLAFQLDTLARHVGKLPLSVPDTELPTHEQQLVASLRHDVRVADVERLASAYEDGDPRPLAGLLTHLHKELPALSDAIALRYLVHAVATQQLSPF